MTVSIFRTEVHLRTEGASPAHRRRGPPPSRSGGPCRGRRGGQRPRIAPLEREGAAGVVHYTTKSKMMFVDVCKFKSTRQDRNNQVAIEIETK